MNKKKLEIDELEAHINNDKQSIFIEWCTNKGFGESYFFIKENEMYCNSEYMGKDTEIALLTEVYRKYGKPEWAKDDFHHGHTIVTDLGPPIVSEFRRFE